VVERHGQVDLVVNNAGVVVSETLDDVTYEDFNWLMGVNFWGVVHGTKAFLPHLRQRPQAYLVNVASINGMVAFPNNGPYVASKFAVTGFTESLTQELEGTGIHVSGVYPGGVRTDIVRRAKFYKAAASDMDRDGMIGRFDESAKTSPEEAARVILDGVRRNRPRILIGRDAWVLDWLKRLFPVWTTRWVARKVRELKNTPRS
jgi:short-subunit dehydrogenase